MLTVPIKKSPILFSGPMIRAILDGRKTMTRRVIKPNILSPYGEAGDHLWVRETWGFTAKTPESFHRSHIKGGGPWLPEYMAYRADEPEGDWCWRPSIFMPRWASRVTLEITEVRVERLQEIGINDAVAEGIEWNKGPTRSGHTNPISAFKATWDQLNAKRGFGWDANPLVWVISFRRIPQAGANPCT